MKSTVTVLVAVGAVLAAAACGDDEVILPNEELDAGGGGKDGSAPRPDGGSVDPDAGEQPKPDAGPPVEDPIKKFTLKLEDVIKAEPPVGPSSYGFASSENAYGGAGTSWRYQKPLTGHANEKLEVYFPFEADAGAPDPTLNEIIAYLGPITVADIASFKIRSRRNDATTRDFSLIVYTKPHADPAKNDASWYARRLHALFEWAHAPAAPAEEWNTFSTSASKNELRFWDYRSANVANWVEPDDRQFSLADLQAGPVTPTGLTDARDYRTETIKFITVTTFSGDTAFDASFDGIELVLKNGKGVNIDLAGDPDYRRISVSRSRLMAVDAPSAGSSFGTGVAGDPWSAKGKAWNFKKQTEDDVPGKFEFYVILGVPADANDADKAKAAIWKGAQDHLGAVKIKEIESLRVQSKKNGPDTNDFMTIIYTLPGADDDDASWYRRRLHSAFAWAGDPDLKADDWNVFSTDGAKNTLRFWDFRHKNTTGTGPVQPNDNFFTLADMQAGEVKPAGLDTGRDYREETVRFLNVSTSSSDAAFDASVDGIEIQLKNKKRLVVDLDD